MSVVGFGGWSRLRRSRRAVAVLDDGTPLMGAWRYFDGREEITRDDYESRIEVAACCGTCAYFLPSESDGSTLGSCRRNHGWHTPDWFCGDYMYRPAQ